LLFARGGVAGDRGVVGQTGFGVTVGGLGVLVGGLLVPVGPTLVQLLGVGRAVVGQSSAACVRARGGGGSSGSVVGGGGVVSGGGIGRFLRLVGGRSLLVSRRGLEIARVGTGEVSGVAGGSCRGFRLALIVGGGRVVAVRDGLLGLVLQVGDVVGGGGVNGGVVWRGYTSLGL
jgi:hypothetical protein